MQLRILFITLLFATLAVNYVLAADGDAISVPPATVSVPAVVSPPDSVATPRLAEKKKGIIAGIIDYFNETNKPRKTKGFDISFIGGPYYSTDTKFGIGLIAAGLYRTDTTDLELPPSDVSLYLKATTSMFFQIGLRGNHIRPHDSARLGYDINIASIKSKFWGIGYDNNIDNANESNYKYLCSEANIYYTWRLAKNLYLGPSGMFNYVNGRDFGKPWLWEDESPRTFNLGVGFTLQYDSRDFLTNASQGYYFRLDQRFNPRFLFNKYAFTLTEASFSTYHTLWKGGVLAYNFHARFTYGNTPWGLLGTLGGSDNMRGYFEGRYRDKNAADMCLEMRQHIWRRNGVVAWIGAGTVFPKFSALRWSKVLPNWGIGYRWEFKKKVNVRLDVGFGRHQTGIIFGINEAF